MNSLEKLLNVLSELKKTFIGKDEIIDLLGICIVARENAFLLGPPGTAKSAIVRMFSDSIAEGRKFEYLLTRFTEPNEIFGPFDIRKLKEGELSTNTEGMMPEASMVFFDEIFNANSAILNSLLMALNEKVFRRGKETKQLPALMFVGASNVLPEDETLNALLDRFLVRIKCDYVQPDLLQEVLVAGRNMDKKAGNEKAVITITEVKNLQQVCQEVNLSDVQQKYIDIIHSLRNAGVKVSDRRAVKLQNLIAASAIICNRNKAILSDLWVLKYIWDTEEQMELLEGIINHITEADEHVEDIHPQANYNKVPNGEEILREVTNLSEQWQQNGLSPEQRNIIKDKLRYVQSRSQWMGQSEQKVFIQKEIDLLWTRILQDVQQITC